MKETFMGNEKELFELPFSEIETAKTLSIIDDLKARVNAVANVAVEEINELKERYKEQARIELESEINKLNNTYQEKLNALEIELKNKEFALDMATKEIEKVKLDSEIAKIRLNSSIAEELANARINMERQKLESEAKLNDKIIEIEKSLMARERDLEAHTKELEAELARLQGQLEQISKDEKYHIDASKAVDLMKSIIESLSKPINTIEVKVPGKEKE